MIAKRASFVAIITLTLHIVIIRVRFWFIWTHILLISHRCNRCLNLLMRVKLILSLQKDLFAVTLIAIVSCGANFWEVLVAALLAFLRISGHKRVGVFVFYSCCQVVLMVVIKWVLLDVVLNVSWHFVLFLILWRQWRLHVRWNVGLGMSHRVFHVEDVLILFKLGLSQMNLLHLLSLWRINYPILLTSRCNFHNIAESRHVVSMLALFGFCLPSYGHSSRLSWRQVLLQGVLNS